MPISVLLGTPFNMGLESSVWAKVSAINVIGMGDYSPTGNGAVISMSYVPDAPVSLARDEVNTNLEQVSLTWSDGASNGGQPILDYRVSFDQGSGNWVVLESSVSSQNLVATGATAGVTYYFKIEARNIIGYSGESESFGIMAAVIPTQPTSVTTERSVNDVIIRWVSPSVDPMTDFGDSFMGFKIYIRTSDLQTYAQEQTYCPDTSTYGTTLCTLPVTALQAEPFNLEVGDSIYAKVLAHNTIGDGAESTPGNNALVSIVIAPDSPVDLTRDNSATTTS